MRREIKKLRSRPKNPVFLFCNRQVVAVNLHMRMSIPRDLWDFASGGWFIWPMRAGELSVGAIATPVQTASCRLLANGRFPREHSIT